MTRDCLSRAVISCGRSGLEGWLNCPRGTSLRIPLRPPVEGFVKSVG